MRRGSGRARALGVEAFARTYRLRKDYRHRAAAQRFNLPRARWQRASPHPAPPT
jgi:hypothetical protein